jgi:hypothetical protein
MATKFDPWHGRAEANQIINRHAKLRDISQHIYTDDEIDEFVLMEAINRHPLSKRPINIRSKLAYKEILNTLPPTKKYLLPGQLVCFEYLEPKFKEDLEYYDRTPLTLFLGITRTKDGNIRELGLNLHYYPPYTRARILNRTYEVFKPYFNKFFNDPSTKPNTIISYDALMHLMKHNDKIAFGIKMYIPVLRSNSYLIPTKMIPTAFYTEGHFSKATLGQIYQFWRQF